MLTTEGAHTVEHDNVKMDTEPHRDTGSKMATDTDSKMEEADMMKWTEAEFEEKCTYIVKDTPQAAVTESEGLTRAEASLPRNLAFKQLADSKEVGGHTHIYIYAPPYAPPNSHDSTEGNI